MTIFNGAKQIRFVRSSAGQTAEVLGDGEAVLGSCDGAGAVTGGGGAVELTATLSMPSEASFSGTRGNLARLKARVDVTDSQGAPVGSIAIRKFSFGPFKKKLELILSDASGEQVGELQTVDKKGRELELTLGGAGVATLTFAERDRGLMRSEELWNLAVQAPPAAPLDLLAEAAILRYNQFVAVLSTPSS
jgi:hypothetical protein